ncbi:hypothetical protein R5R35_013290 [Gryllus longicercus]|uniref:Uncharacterized protein n=1 Tax=Gryllus longicercus TaxID=2509291 RepID=A0AAN9V2S9_9ORTH
MFLKTYSLLLLGNGWPPAGGGGRREAQDGGGAGGAVAGGRRRETGLKRFVFSIRMRCQAAGGRSGRAYGGRPARSSHNARPPQPAPSPPLPHSVLSSLPPPPDSLALR